VALWIVTILCTLIATWLTLRDVALSAIAMFVIEILSMAAMMVLLVIVAYNHAASLIDPTQLSLEGVTAHQLAQGVAFSLLAFAAFESSLFLGKEAKNPLTQMSRAITWSVVICGILFMVFTYVMSIGLRGITPGFAENPNPLRALAEANHVGFLNNFVQPGVIIALFGVTIANLNFASRLLMTLSKERMLPATFAHVSARHRTPSKAILFVAGLDVIVLTLLSLTGHADFAAYGFLGGLSGYWVGVTYILASAAMMYYLMRRKELTPLYAAAGLLSIIAFLYFFWTSSAPLPASPGDVILLIFYATMALSVLHWLFLKMRKSPVLDMLGTSATRDPG
jgi:amino acid transporter